MTQTIVIDRPRLTDVPRMKQILDVYAEGGELLARSRMDIYERIRDFVVARENGVIIGLSALHILWEDLGEIRSLAVVKDARSRGVGGLLMERCLADARDLGITKVFTLTYRPEFFHRFKFTEVEKNELPHKVWKACLDCVKFPDCDEIALIREV